MLSFLRRELLLERLKCQKEDFAVGENGNENEGERIGNNNKSDMEENLTFWIP
jgi:hypothetical protein